MYKKVKLITHMYVEGRVPPGEFTWNKKPTNQIPSHRGYEENETFETPFIRAVYKIQKRKFKNAIPK